MTIVKFSMKEKEPKLRMWNVPKKIRKKIRGTQKVNEIKKMITKCGLSMDNDIMVIRTMRNLDLDHRPRRGIPNVSLLDKHSTRPQLPIYLPIKPIIFNTNF